MKTNRFTNIFCTLLLMFIGWQVTVMAADNVTLTPEKYNVEGDYYYSETYKKLFDSTKQYAGKFSKGNGSVWVEFSASKPIYLNGYYIYSGKEATGVSKNPKTWKLYAKLNKNDMNWLEISSVEDGKLPEGSFAKSGAFTIYPQYANLAFTYFKYEFTAIEEGDDFEIGNFELDYKTSSARRYVAVTETDGTVTRYKYEDIAEIKWENPMLSPVTPVGTQCIVDKRDAVVVDLGGEIGKVAVATKNVGAADEMSPGTYMNQTEAIDAFANGTWGEGWYVPSDEELKALANLDGYWDNKKKAWVIPVGETEIYLPAGGLGNGYFNSERGYYWSRTNNIGSFDALEFTSKGITQYPSYYSAQMNVRLFHKIPLNAPAPTPDAKPALPEITLDSSVGTYGIYHGREAIVADLGGDIGKVAIATKNIGATEFEPYGTYMSENDAVVASISDMWGMGWRLPTNDEIEALLKMTNSFDDINKAHRFTISSTSTLYLPAGGHKENGSLTNIHTECAYMTNAMASTQHSGDNVYTDYGSNHFTSDHNAANTYLVRPFCSLKEAQELPVITDDSPVGTHGILNGVEAVVVDLGSVGRYAVATKNVGAMNATDFGSYFNYNDANNASKTGLTGGWHTPSKAELSALAAQMTWIQDYTTPKGNKISVLICTYPTTMTSLLLPGAGYNGGTGSNCVYWTSESGCRLDMSSSTLNIATGKNNSTTTPVRAFYKLAGALTPESPAGTIGVINGRKAMVVDLGSDLGKVAVALENVGADESNNYVGKYFTYAEANNPAKTGLANGWYVPTKIEYKALFNQMTWTTNMEREGVKTGAQLVIDGNKLYLPAVGYYYNNQWYGNVDNFRKCAYWSSTISENNKAPMINITDSYKNIVYNDVAMKTPIRPIYRLTGEKPGLEYPDELDSNSPEGAYGFINGRPAIVVNLGSPYGKVAVATENVGATASDNSGSVYSFADANKPSVTGLTGNWYIPSKDEIQALSKKMTWTTNIPGNNKNGAQLTFNHTSRVLYLPAIGYYFRDKWYYKDTDCFYWTRSKSSYSGEGWCLDFESTKYSMYSYDDRYLMPIRPFCSLSEAAPEPDPDPIANPDISMPVGTLCVLDGLEAVIVDLGGRLGKVAVATKNIGASNTQPYGQYMTPIAAQKASDEGTWGEGWYIPSNEEIVALISNDGGWDDTQKTWIINVGDYKLSLPAAGFYDSERGENWSVDFFIDYITLPLGDNYKLLVETGQRITNECNSRDLYTVRAFHQLPGKVIPGPNPSNDLDENSPAGTVGMIDGRKAVVVDFGEPLGKVAVAITNVGAGNVSDCGSYLSIDEAYEASENGDWGYDWCLPSYEELKLLFEMGQWDESHKAWRIDVEGYPLYLPANGYYSNYHNMVDGLGSSCLYFTTDRDLHHAINYGRDGESTSKPSAYVTKYGARLFHRLTKPTTLNRFSPIGTIGEINGRRAMVMETVDEAHSANRYKVAVALDNVGATSENPLGTLMTYDEAVAASDNRAWGEGWYLPNQIEMTELGGNLGNKFWNDEDNLAIYTVGTKKNGKNIYNNFTMPPYKVNPSETGDTDNELPNYQSSATCFYWTRDWAWIEDEEGNEQLVYRAMQMFPIWELDLKNNYIKLPVRPIYRLK